MEIRDKNAIIDMKDVESFVFLIGGMNACKKAHFTDFIAWLFRMFHDAKLYRTRAKFRCRFHSNESAGNSQ